MTRAATAPETTRWAAVVVILVAGVAASFQVGKVPVALPVIRGELALDLTEAAWIVSIFSVISMVGGMTAGSMGDRIGHRRILLTGLLVLAAANFIGAYASDPGLLLFSRLCEGLAFLIVSVSCPALLFRVCSERHWRLIFGMWGAYWPFGTAAMMLVAPLALSTVGWRGFWVANGLFALAAALLLLRARSAIGAPPAPRPRAAPVSWQDIARTATSPGPLLLASIFATYAAVLVTMLSFLPTLYLEQQDMSPGRIAVLTAVVAAANMGGNLLAGFALHKGVPRWILLALAFVAMATLSFAVYGTALPFPVRYGAAFAFSFLGGMIPTSCLAGAPVHAPEPRLLGTTNGLLMQGSGLGQVVGPVVTTLAVTAAGGWAVTPLVFGVSAVLGIVCALGVRALERRPRP